MKERGSRKRGLLRFIWFISTLGVYLGQGKDGSGFLEHGRNWSGRPAFAFRRIGAWDWTATRDQGLNTHTHTKISPLGISSRPHRHGGVHLFDPSQRKLAFEVLLDGYLGQTWQRHKAYFSLSVAVESELIQMSHLEGEDSIEWNIGKGLGLTRYIHIGTASGVGIGRFFSISFFLFRASEFGLSRELGHALASTAFYIFIKVDEAYHGGLQAFFW
jgi:hypothetical protein